MTGKVWQGLANCYQKSDKYLPSLPDLARGLARVWQAILLCKMGYLPPLPPLPYV
jgi:hypothetical protein